MQAHQFSKLDLVTAEIFDILQRIIRGVFTPILMLKTKCSIKTCSLTEIPVDF